MIVTQPLKSATLKVLGIDPGSLKTGFACVEIPYSHRFNLSRYRLLDIGVMKTKPSLSFNVRICQLHQAMSKIIEEIKPDVCVMESAFFGKNPQSALKLGHARGAFLAATARFETKLCEISPTNVKRVICGHGHADKSQVCHALEGILGFQKGKLSFDATDALAVACAMSATTDLWMLF